MDWISVKDRLPEEGDDFLVCVKEKNGYCYIDIMSFWIRVGEWSIEGVTHWMPLPELPKK